MSLWDDHEPNPPRQSSRKSKPKLRNPLEKEEEKKVSKSSLFSRGFNDVRSRVERGSRFTMSCYNCEYFYQASGDKEEVCQNPDVLKYDMVITESSIYCNHWELVKREQSVRGMFKKKR